MRLSITVNDSEVRQALEIAQNRLKSLRPAFAAAGEYLRRQTEMRFKNEVSPDGQPFAPLTAEYLKRKNRGTKILTRLGTLRGSITYDATDDQVEIGTNLIYARAHQYGYTPRNLPARPFLGINDQDANEIEAIFADYLESS